MKSILRNFKDTVDIYNLVSNGAKLDYILQEDSVPCHIQSNSGSYAENNSGMYGKEYYIFLGYRDDINEGTKLVDNSSGISLRVSSVENFKINGVTRHMEVVATAFHNINT